jgi:uncharacterized damage-inducible protein DinB
MEARYLSKQLLASWQGPAWHGPSLRESIKHVDAALAAPKIWGLWLHAHAWQRAVHAVVCGGAYLSLTGDENFPPVASATEEAWKTAQAEMEATMRALAAGVAELSEEKLREKVPGQPYSFYVMLHGVGQHNIYHAGQIMLLKRQAGVVG